VVCSLHVILLYTVFVLFAVDHQSCVELYWITCVADSHVCLKSMFHGSVLVACTHTC
jgi:hypothetical protein